MSLARRRQLVEGEHPPLSIARQCALLGVSLSGLYYRPKGVSREDLALMQAMDRQYLETPFYGSRRMKVWLVRQGCQVSRKRVQRLMRIMGLRAIYRRPRTSRAAPDPGSTPTCWKMSKLLSPTRYGRRTSPICPWPGGSSTWCFLPGGHHGLAQPVRGGLAPVQHLGGGLEADFCVEALQEALGRGRPGISNTDQGSQFTSREFTSREFTQVLRDHEVRISMDGRRRYADNIFVERLWRTVKYEEVYLKAYADAKEARRELGAYFRFYNDQRPHQALGYRTSAEVYHQAMNVQGGRRRKGGVHRNRREYHWQGQRGSRLIPPRSCPNGRVHLRHGHVHG